METQFTKRQYSTNQVSLITKAMLIAGAFFLIIGGGSLGLSYAFKYLATPAGMNLWMPIMLLCMLGGMIVSMVLIAAMLKGNSPGLIFLGFFLYTAVMSTVFGYLFAFMRNHFNDNNMFASIAFGVTAFIFLFAALIAKLTSAKGVFTMGKLIAGTSVAMSIMMIVFLILGIVGIASRSTGTWLASQAIFNFIMIAMCFVSFIYIVIDIWSISKMSEFAEMTMGDAVPPAFVWYCGYRLLVDLLDVLLWVILIIIRYARRAQ